MHRNETISSYWRNLATGLGLVAANIGIAVGAVGGLPLWSTIEAGGGAAYSRAYSLVGAAGQPDAGRLVGGGFSLSGGYIGAGVTATAVDDPTDPSPVPAAVFRFHPIAPNPFNPTTTIAFDLPDAEQVEVRIYGLRGELVAVLLDDALPKGRHVLTWRGADSGGRTVASGVYFVDFKAGPHHVQRKITLVR